MNEQEVVLLISQLKSQQCWDWYEDEIDYLWECLNDAIDGDAADLIEAVDIWYADAVHELTLLGMESLRVWKPLLSSAGAEACRHLGIQYSREEIRFEWHKEVACD